MDRSPDIIDVALLEKNLEEELRSRDQQKAIATQKAQSFYDGFEAGIKHVKKQLHDEKFESAEKSSRAFANGMNSFIYQLGKELGINCEDIRDMEGTYKVKAGKFAERVREAYAKKSD